MPIGDGSPKKWAVGMRQSWSMPPDDSGVWDGKDWTTLYSKAELYPDKAAAELAMVGLALLYPEEKTPNYERRLYLIPVDTEAEKRWKSGASDDQDG